MKVSENYSHFTDAEVEAEPMSNDLPKVNWWQRKETTRARHHPPAQPAAPPTHVSPAGNSFSPKSQLRKPVERGPLSACQLTRKSLRVGKDGRSQETDKARPLPII